MAKQSSSNVYLSKPYRLSSHCWSPKRKSTFNVSSHTIAIASTAAALATVGTLYVSQSEATYTGRIQLVGLLPTPLSGSSTDGAGQTQPIVSPSLGHSNIAPPDLINALDEGMIWNSDMATTVVENLNQQGIPIRRATLLKHLSAQTSPQGWLELQYEDEDLDRVEQILAEVAQWYVSQESNCDIKACDDVMFIAAQLPILEQRQQELEQDIRTLHQTTSQLTQQPLPTTHLEKHIQTLLVQQHEQIQHMAQVETRMDELLAQLEQYQIHMNLSHVEPKTGVALLRETIPNYDSWLRQWQDGDRHLVDLTLARQIDGNLSTISVISPSHQPLSHHMEHVLSQHNRLHDEMKQTVHQVVHQPLANMPLLIRELIMDDVVRFEPMKRWILTLHQLQLLEARRHTLEVIQQDTDTLVQEWQEAMAMRVQLQRELDIVNGTLASYRDRYTTAQYQAAQAELTWQVVAPPEVVQQPQEWVGTWASNMLRKSNRLITLNEP